MGESIQEFASGIVKHTSTPTRFFMVVVIVIGALLKWGNLGVVSNLILICVLSLIVIAYVLFLAFDPKRLVFRAEEHITWHREKLGDSSLKHDYIIGQKKPTDVELIEIKDDDSDNIQHSR